jgi:fibronectin-binding autotransporter adhesin
MKKKRTFLQQIILCTPLVIVPPLQAADVTKAEIGTDLANGESWGGTVPTADDRAVWTSTSLGAGLTLDTPSSWNGIRVDGALSDIAITGIGALTLNAGGIDTSGSDQSLSIGNPILADGPQTWKTGGQLSFTGPIAGSSPLNFQGNSLAVQTYSAEYMNPTAAVLFPNTSLATVTGALGIMNGGIVGAVDVPANAYKFENNGSVATFQLRAYVGGYTKVVKVELTQSGDDIIGRAVYAKYLASMANDLTFDFDAGGSNNSIATGPFAQGYGISSLTIQIGENTQVSLAGHSPHSGGMIFSGGSYSGGNGVGYSQSQGGSFGTGSITLNQGAVLTTTGARVLGGGDTTTRIVNIDGATVNIEGAGAGGEYIRSINLTGGTLTSPVTGTYYFRAPHGGLDIHSLGSDSSSLITTGIDLTYTSLSLNVADGAAANDLVLNGVISQNTGAGSGAKSLTKAGTGTLLLAGANSYTGNTVVQEGIIKVGNKNAFGAFQAGRPAAAITVASGSAIDFNGIIDSTFGYTISGDGPTGEGALMNRAGAIGDYAAQCSNITLAADASIGGTGNWSMIANGFGLTTLDLQGHTLTKTGPNMVGLVSTTATAGEIRIEQGTLRFGRSGSGTDSVDAPNTSVVLGDQEEAWLEVTRNSVIGSLSGGATGGSGGHVKLTSGTLTVGTLNTDTTFEGYIDGDGSFVKSGTGKLTLTDNDFFSFSGAATVASGVLALAGDGMFGYAHTLTVQEGAQIETAQLQIGSSATLGGEGSLTGGLRLAPESILAVDGESAGVLSVAGSLVVDGEVAVSLSSAVGGNTPFDVIQFGSYSGNAATDFTLLTPARAGYAFTRTTNRVQLSLNVENKIWSNALGDGIWDAHTSSNWSGGSDELFYAFDSVIFGDTNAGSVTVGGGLQVSDVTFTNTLGNDYNLKGEPLTIAGTLSVTGSGDVTIDSILTGQGGVAKSGTGTLTLTAANTYAGGTSMDGGKIVATNTAAFGQGEITLGATSDDVDFLLSTRADLRNALTVSAAGSGQVTIGADDEGTGTDPSLIWGTLTLNRPTTISGGVFSDRFGIEGKITGTVGTLTFVGGGRTTISSAENDFIGDVVVSGERTILQSGIGYSNESIPDTSNVRVEEGATFQLAISLSGSETIAGLYGDGTVRTYVGGSFANGLIVGSGDADGNFSGALENGTGPLSFAKIGSGVQILSGVNTYSGATRVEDGTLSVTGSLSGNTAVTVTAPGAFKLGEESSLGDSSMSFLPTTNGVTNAITGDGSVYLNGDLVIDLTSADATPGNEWRLIDVTSLEVTYGNNFQVADFTAIRPGVWMAQEGEVVWTFTTADGVLRASSGTSTGGFGDWAAANAPGQTMGMDHDGDGTPNGIEFFMGESGSGFTARPVQSANGTISWSKGASYAGVYGTDYVVETSANLQDWEAVPADDQNLTDGEDGVEYSFPSNTEKRFARLKVMEP